MEGHVLVRATVFIVTNRSVCVCVGLQLVYSPVSVCVCSCISVCVRLLNNLNIRGQKQPEYITF